MGFVHSYAGSSAHWAPQLAHLREPAELQREIEGRPEHQKVRERLLPRVQWERAGSA